MKKLVILAIAGLMSVTASASNWVLVGEEVTGTKAYVDTDSITVSGNFRNAFIRHNFAEINTGYYGEFDSLTIYQQFNCVSRPKQHRYLSSVIRLKGKVVISNDYSNFSSPPWEVAYPDSIGELVGNFICSY